MSKITDTLTLEDILAKQNLTVSDIEQKLADVATVVIEKWSMLDGYEENEIGRLRDQLVEAFDNVLCPVLLTSPPFEAPRSAAIAYAHADVQRRFDSVDSSPVQAAFERAALLCDLMHDSGEGGSGCKEAARRIRKLESAAPVPAPAMVADPASVATPLTDIDSSEFEALMFAYRDAKFLSGHYRELVSFVNSKLIEAVKAARTASARALGVAVDPAGATTPLIDIDSSEFEALLFAYRDAEFVRGQYRDVVAFVNGKLTEAVKAARQHQRAVSLAYLQTVASAVTLGDGSAGGQTNAQFTGVVEKVEFTHGGAGNQWTTIDGVTYATWWNIASRDWKIGDSVTFRAAMTQLWGDKPPVPSASHIMQEQKA